MPKTTEDEIREALSQQESLELLEIGKRILDNRIEHWFRSDNAVLALPLALARLCFVPHRPMSLAWMLSPVPRSVYDELQRMQHAGKVRMIRKDCSLGFRHEYSLAN